MSAAAPAPVVARLSEEGKRYWDHLVGECKRQAQAINKVVSEHGFDPGDFIEYRPGPGLHLVKPQCPSTTVKLTINYCSWGPMIDAVITGYEEEDLQFCPEELTIPIARDLDGGVVAIFEEGRSFSPSELATFFMQNFRRCFPGLSLPCEQVA